MPTRLLAGLLKPVRGPACVRVLLGKMKIMKRIFLDIETLPAAETHREFVDQLTRAKALKKGAVADAAELAQAFDRTALRGSLGRLLGLGLIYEKDGVAECRGVLGWDKATEGFHLDEARTLQSFWKYLSKIDFDPQHDLLIGHNILQFDLPFLYQRSMVHGVRPSVELSLYLYQNQPIYDTMRQWERLNVREYYGLAELARACGLDCPKSGDVTGGNLPAAFAAGRHAAIRAYCLNDVVCVRRLYYRMTYQTMNDE